MKRKLKYKRSFFEHLYTILTFIFLFILSISLIVPFAWAIMSSFKDVVDFTVNPFGFPEKFYFSNYAEALSKLKVSIFTEDGLVRYGVGTMLANSIIWALFSPLLTTFFTMTMAYILTKYKFFGSKFLYNFGIVLMVVHLVGTFPAGMKLGRMLGTYDNMLMTILTSPVGCFSGMNFLIFCGNFKAIPKDYDDAARLDGAGHFLVMFYIMIPMVLPTFFCFYFLGFLGAWNDYSTMLTWLPSYPTLSYGTYLFDKEASQYGVTMPVILAGYIIVVIPSIIFYFCINKLMIERVQVGGLKG